MAQTHITMAQHAAEVRIREAELSMAADGGKHYINVEIQDKISRLEHRHREDELRVQQAETLLETTRAETEEQMQRAEQERQQSLAAMEQEYSATVERLEEQFASDWKTAEATAEFERSTVFMEAEMTAAEERTRYLYFRDMLAEQALERADSRLIQKCFSTWVQKCKSGSTSCVTDVLKDAIAYAAHGYRMVKRKDRAFYKWWLASRTANYAYKAELMQQRVCDCHLGAQDVKMLGHSFRCWTAVAAASVQARADLAAAEDFESLGTVVAEQHYGIQLERR
eukprot:COSAG02_NODE_20147_length_846_cov_1.484605_1_plen_281_part_11